MGKVTWGGGVTADTIDGAERSEFKPYDGPPVPNGVYAFKIKLLRKAVSSKGNPQIRVGLELVPRASRPDDKPYKGFFLSDWIPVMESTANRLAPFLDAIGVKGADFVNRTTDDGTEQANILRIGKKTPVGMYVLANVVDGTDQKGNVRKEVSYGGYYPPPTGAAPAASDDASDADDGAGADDDPPF